MHRILIRIPLPFGDGSIPVYSYGFMILLAFVVGTYLAWRRARQAGVDGQLVLDLALYALISGIFGARLAYLIFDHIPDPAAHPLLDLVSIWKGGLTFQGGLVVALGVCLWYLSARNLAPGKVADWFAPSVMLGVALGRVGCFLNGCCWGKICPPDLPVGVRFPDGSMVHHHHMFLRDAGVLWQRMQEAGYAAESMTPPALPLPVHPAQLYTALALVGVFLLLLLVERLPRLFDGMVMLVGLMAYSVVRFVVEFWRDDTYVYWAYGAFPGLKLGQILAVFTLLASVIAFIYLWSAQAEKRRGERSEEESA